MASKTYEDELTGNELANLYTFIQIIQVGKENLQTDDQIEKTESYLHAYIQNALNDHPLNSLRHPNVQLPFYDARLDIERDDIISTRMYMINFQILSLRYWNKNARKKLMEKYFQKLQTNVTTARLVSEKIVESLSSFTRDPTSNDALAHRDKPEYSNIPGDNFLKKILNYWLIVPRTQWDISDVLHQMYTFDIFHQGFFSKYVHFFTIPTNVLLLMVFLAQFNIPTLGELRYGNVFAVNLALVLFGIFGVAYVIIGVRQNSWEWGVATFGVLAILNMAGNVWYYSYRAIDNRWYNPTNIYSNPLVWSYIVSFMQTASHLVVPQLPPNVTGTNYWESYTSFFTIKRKTKESTIKHMVFLSLSVVLFPVLFVFDEWVSSPRLLGTEVLYIMTGIGYRPKIFQRYFRVVEKAVLHGNPIIDRFPTNYNDLRFDTAEQIQSKEENGFVSENKSAKS
ncbi:unnamed protein product [Mytilus edulis]|uniref:Uncharacterized protein n=1 Tax=Mytilus edulis TaxID=6550 RepID=A0A8S3QVV1_MYTED|nr:unnamed protein product [Mytilus edulis]